mmetsp:Transcript_10357/g.21990  ORF Transcript_10357/g.21990 Transcript_10357/m.21990 type:complete len:93 (+) Transcript_10357:60-338(+)
MPFKLPVSKLQYVKATSKVDGRRWESSNTDGEFKLELSRRSWPWDDGLQVSEPESRPVQVEFKAVEIGAEPTRRGFDGVSAGSIAAVVTRGG